MTDNKIQIIHIVAEVIIICGLTFYTVNRNKKLLCYIQDLEQKISQQEELLQNHDKLIIKLSQNVNSLHSLVAQTKNEKKIIKENVSKKVISPLPTNISTSKKVMIMIPEIKTTIEKVPTKSSKVEEINDDVLDVVNNNRNNDDSLDDELEKELNELDEEIINIVSNNENSID
jgi:phage shock protein A